MILHWMYNGEYLLTKDNYKEYLNEEIANYTDFDFESLNGQEDYEADFYAAALLNEELTGAKPVKISERDIDDLNLSDAGIGAEISFSDVDDYRYLVFYGKKATKQGQLAVYVYNEEGEKVANITKNHSDLDKKWHQYVIDITDIKGNIKIVFNGGYIDNTGNTDSDYIFRDITLY